VNQRIYSRRKNMNCEQPLLRRRQGVPLVVTIVIALAALWLASCNDRADRRPAPKGTQNQQADEDHGHDHGDNADHKDHDHGDDADHKGHDHGDDADHKGHDHGADDRHHPGHVEANALDLSEQGRKNVGLKTKTVKLQPFERTIPVPAMVVERPGRSQIEITAPFTGVVTRIHPIQGEAVTPGQALFELRLTHEDLVTAQAEYLQVAGELDVVRAEIARLESVGEGVIAGKTLLARKYERQKLEAVLRAHHQKLLLHTLTDEQVKQIHTTRSLLQKLTVVAPDHSNGSTVDSEKPPFHVQRLGVNPGQHVMAGDGLCTLADHHELLIEGKAFEEDGDHLHLAMEKEWTFSAAMMQSGKQRRLVRGLQILYGADTIEADSRALPFYVRLPNEMVHDDQREGSPRFISWRYKPGQRVELLLPVERWERRIVLPVDAVVREGAESFVFEKNVDHFDRVEVHVEYRDQYWAVIAPGGTLKPGDTVVVAGAYQMHLEMKKRAGGGIDLHAGHGH